MELNISGTLAILVITWLVVQAVKSTKIDNRLLPLLSVVVGVVIAFVVSLYTKDTKLVQDVVVGAFTGFGATGVNETMTKSVNAIFEMFSKTFSSSVDNDVDKVISSVEDKTKEANTNEVTPNNDSSNA